MARLNETKRIRWLNGLRAQIDLYLQQDRNALDQHLADFVNQFIELIDRPKNKSNLPRPLSLSVKAPNSHVSIARALNKAFEDREDGCFADAIGAMSVFGNRSKTEDWIKSKEGLSSSWSSSEPRVISKWLESRDDYWGFSWWFADTLRRIENPKANLNKRYSLEDFGVRIGDERADLVKKPSWTAGALKMLSDLFHGIAVMNNPQDNSPGTSGVYCELCDEFAGSDIRYCSTHSDPNKRRSREVIFRRLANEFGFAQEYYGKNIPSVRDSIWAKLEFKYAPIYKSIYGHVNKDALRNFINRFGINKDRGRKPQVDLTEARRLRSLMTVYGKPLPFSVIADLMGCSRQYIQQALKETE